MLRLTVINLHIQIGEYLHKTLSKPYEVLLNTVHLKKLMER